MSSYFLQPSASEWRFCPISNRPAPAVPESRRARCPWRSGKSGSSQYWSGPGRPPAWPRPGRHGRTSWRTGAAIVGKHLARCHARLVAQCFHLRPDLPAGDAFFVSGEKNLAGSDFLFPGVFEELAAELARQQDGPDLALQGDFGPSPVHGLHGDIAHLGHPDSGAANGFQQQRQPFPALGAGGLQQAEVLRPRQLPAVVPEQPPAGCAGVSPETPASPEIQGTG